MDLWMHFEDVFLGQCPGGRSPPLAPASACIRSRAARFKDTVGLDAHWFTSLAETRAGLEVWRKEYNTERPHSALAMKTPAEFAARWRPPEQANACS
jgi:transposase InsO family protein